MRAAEELRDRAHLVRSPALPYPGTSANPQAFERASAWASTLLDKAIAVGLLTTLVLTALAHGAVEPWSVAVFELLLIATLLLWGLKIILDRAIDIHIPPLALPILGLLVFGIVQSATFSADIEATRHTITTLAFLFIGFIVAVNSLKSTDRMLLLANVLTVFGAVLAVFALIQHFAWDGSFYWIRPTRASVFGPFVNRNHFAGYMAMITPVPVGLVLTVIRGHKRLIYGFAAAMMGTAAVISSSRSGLVSVVSGLALLALMNKFNRGPSQPRAFKVGAVALVAATIAAGVFWIGASSPVERFGKAVDAGLRTGSPDPSRTAIWRETFGLVRDHPVGGTGLGTFHTVYPRYGRTPDLLGLDYAHNDYLQILAEAGVIGGVLALWFVGLLAVSIRRGVQSRDPLFVALSLGAGAGIFAVAVQTLAETDLQIPSNALLFFALCAIVSFTSEPKQIALYKGSQK